MSSIQSRSINLAVALAAGLLAGLSVPGTALAQWPGMGGGGGRGPGPAPFERIDRDGDGAISAAEHAQFRAERQRAMAAQGRPMRNAGNAPAFGDIDADGDGRITPAEMAAARQARLGAGPGYGPGVGPGYGRGPGPGFGPGPGGVQRPCGRPGW
jgi:hypothetical protein